MSKNNKVEHLNPSSLYCQDIHVLYWFIPVVLIDVKPDLVIIVIDWY
jgi:hypothetical protein